MNVGGIAGSSFSKFLVPEKAPENPDDEQDVFDPDNCANWPSLSVLLIEDNKLNQSIMHRRLKSIGFADITIASDGMEAVNLLKLKSKKFDLIITDIDMPKLNGIDVARVIKHENLSSAPIVAWTSNETEKDQLKFKKVGMSGFMPKRVEVLSMRKELNRCLTRPNSPIREQSPGRANSPSRLQ